MEKAQCILNKKTVSLLGINSLFGRITSLLLKQSGAIKSLSLYDENDISTACDVSVINTSCKVRAFQGKEQLACAIKNADVILIADPCNYYCDSPEVILEEEAPRIIEYGKVIAESCSRAIILVAANPINCIVPLLSQVLTFYNAYDCNKVLGVTSVDTIRANSILATHLKLDARKVVLPVVGGNSPETRVPIYSQARPDPKLSKKIIKRMTKEIKYADEYIFRAKREMEAINKAYATTRFVHSVLAALRGEQNIAEIAFTRTLFMPGANYFALPFILGTNGIEYRFPLPEISNYEGKLIKNAVLELYCDIKKGEKYFSINDGIDPENVLENKEKGIIINKLFNQYRENRDCQKNKSLEYLLMTHKQNIRVPAIYKPAKHPVPAPIEPFEHCYDGCNPIELPELPTDRRRAPPIAGAYSTTCEYEEADPPVVYRRKKCQQVGSCKFQTCNFPPVVETPPHLPASYSQPCCDNLAEQTETCNHQGDHFQTVEHLTPQISPNLGSNEECIQKDTSKNSQQSSVSDSNVNLKEVISQCTKQRQALLHKIRAKKVSQSECKDDTTNLFPLTEHTKDQTAQSCYPSESSQKHSMDDVTEKTQNLSKSDPCNPDEKEFFRKKPIQTLLSQMLLNKSKPQMSSTSKSVVCAVSEKLRDERLSGEYCTNDEKVAKDQSKDSKSKGPKSSPPPPPPPPTQSPSSSEECNSSEDAEVRKSGKLCYNKIDGSQITNQIHEVDKKIHKKSIISELNDKGTKTSLIDALDLQINSKSPISNNKIGLITSINSSLNGILKVSSTDIEQNSAKSTEKKKDTLSFLDAIYKKVFSGIRGKKLEKHVNPESDSKKGVDRMEPLDCSVSKKTEDLDTSQNKNVTEINVDRTKINYNNTGCTKPANYEVNSHCDSRNNILSQHYAPKCPPQYLFGEYIQRTDKEESVAFDNVKEVVSPVKAYTIGRDARNRLENKNQYSNEAPIRIKASLKESAVNQKPVSDESVSTDIDKEIRSTFDRSFLQDTQTFIRDPNRIRNKILYLKKQKSENQIPNVDNQFLIEKNNFDAKIEHKINKQQKIDYEIPTGGDDGKKHFVHNRGYSMIPLTSPNVGDLKYSLSAIDRIKQSNLKKKLS